MGIQFKFREGLPPDGARPSCGLCRRPPAHPRSRCSRLEDDPELASLFRLETDAPALVEQLNQLEDVEFAEPDVQRKLIR